LGAEPGRRRVGMDHTAQWNRNALPGQVSICSFYCSTISPQPLISSAHYTIFVDNSMNILKSPCNNRTVYKSVVSLQMISIKLSPSLSSANPSCVLFISFSSQHNICVYSVSRKEPLYQDYGGQTLLNLGGHCGYHHYHHTSVLKQRGEVRP
jgi:hypothetical protein